MCGIAGILGQDIDLRSQEKLMVEMSDTLKMRGPDDKGEYVDNDVMLIHRRLSIIDPQYGSQPMRFGNLIIVYNGELYNTGEVRSELESKGYIFTTSCDTEVVLKAYHFWGDDSVKKLNGIFAYAIYDTNTGELFATRDRIGVKPFFYSTVAGRFAFASRIKTLLCVPWIEPVVDENGLYEVFMLGPAKTMGKAVFRDIDELLPGHSLKYSNGILTLSCYWSLQAKVHTDTLDETLDYTHYLVKDAIERQLVSDVNVCTFLSGGLDSSIISRVAADNLFQRGEVLDTYSVDYVDNDKYFEKSLFQPNKDSDFIDLIASYIGSSHHNIVLDNTAVADALIDAAKARSLPGFADVDSSLLLFCGEVKKDHKVCLSGECADEIFGGYPWYHRKEILFEETFPWSRSTMVRQSILRDGFLKNGEEYAHSAYLDTVKKTQCLDSDSPLERRMREMFCLNLDWFMQTLLSRKDIMSMENSLEVRVPFCDYRIVEYAYNMPWSMKSFDGREKGILRKAFEKDLPKEITWRKKSPYPKTFNPIYFQRVKEMVLDVLSDKECPLCDMLDSQRIIELCNSPESMSEPWYGQLMRTPQVLAYIVQIYVWIKDCGVTFV